MTASKKIVSKANRARTSAGKSAKPTIASSVSTKTGRGAGTKLERLVVLLQKPGGATMPALQTATGWQPHSVRGAISGAIKKKLGHNVVSSRDGGVRVYRIDV